MYASQEGASYYIVQLNTVEPYQSGHQKATKI